MVGFKTLSVWGFDQRGCLRARGCGEHGPGAAGVTGVHEGMELPLIAYILSRKVCVLGEGEG